MTERAQAPESSAKLAGDVAWSVFRLNEDERIRHVGGFDKVFEVGTGQPSRQPTGDKLKSVTWREFLEMFQWSGSRDPLGGLLMLTNPYFDGQET
ncbi:MAG: hypothetical protein HYX74_04600 [Acidobacteria bacterium]|nr:hypothetical protein [Acidobacteriota bacterium]